MKQITTIEKLEAEIESLKYLIKIAPDKKQVERMIKEKTLLLNELINEKEKTNGN